MGRRSVVVTTVANYLQRRKQFPRGLLGSLDPMSPAQLDICKIFFPHLVNLMPMSSLIFCQFGS